MLRKNWQNNANIRKPATCHGAIPQLTPAKYFHAMASIDYTLIVCGGMISEWIVTLTAVLSLSIHFTHIFTQK